MFNMLQSVNGELSVTIVIHQLIKISNCRGDPYLKIIMGETIQLLSKKIFFVSLS